MGIILATIKNSFTLNTKRAFDNAVKKSIFYTWNGFRMSLLYYI